MAYITGDYALFNSTLYSNDSFKRKFISLTSKKTFYLYTAMSFIYSGSTFFAVKAFNEQIKTAFSGIGFYLIAMLILFVILSAAAGIKLNNMRHETEKEPIKMFGMLNHIVYTTFLFATLYLLFNSAIITIISEKISAILTLCDLRINIPIAIILLAFLAITKGKENFMKKWYIYLVVSVLIAFELAVSDIISLSIMLLVGKINFFKWNNNAADLISVSAAVIGALLTLSLVYFGAWPVILISAIIIAIVLFNERTYISSITGNTELKREV